MSETSEMNVAVTYWNGEVADCERVRVVVGESPLSTWWCASLAGTVRNAVRVCYEGRTFYLDNDAWSPEPSSGLAKLDEVGLGPEGYEAGGGWWKVTKGFGDPQYGHSELPVEREV